MGCRGETPLCSMPLCDISFAGGTRDTGSEIYLYDSEAKQITRFACPPCFIFWREYDALGRQWRATDPYGRSTYFYYDAADRMTRTVAPDGSEVLFSYDRNGNATAITPPGKPEHTFDYSLIDLETLYTPPFVGDSSRATARAYTLDKEALQILRPDSLNITLQYGGTNSLAGQPKRIFFDRGVTTNLYDTTKALQIGVIAPTGDSLRYQYDGTMLRRITWSGPNGLNSVKGGVGFSYNTDMQVSTETVLPAAGGADSVNLKYDKDGLITSAGALKLKYDPTNNLLLSDTLGGVVTNYAYTTFGELARKEVKFGATTLLRLDYSRDSLGRITQKLETSQGSSQKHNYAYDVVGRLWKVWRNDTLISEYTYDANGNRLAKVTPTSVDSGTYDAQDRLLKYGKGTYEHSKYGDLQNKIEGGDTTQYVYDAFGSLVSVRLPNGDLIEYLLDGNGVRVGRKVNGVVTQKWLYSNNLRIVAELDSANNVVSRFVYTTSENVPEYMLKGGVIYRIVTDHLGSVKQVVNTQSAEVVEQVDYDEFGNVVLEMNLGFVPFAFAGGINDTHTKLVRFGVRDFDARIGKWVAKDPTLFKDSPNVYSYASNDPLNSLDPRGTMGWSGLMGNALAARSVGVAIGFASGGINAAIESRGDIGKTIAGAMIGASMAFVTSIPQTAMGGARAGAAAGFLGTLLGSWVGRGEISVTPSDVLKATDNAIMGGALGALGAVASTPMGLRVSRSSLVGIAATIGLMQSIWDIAMTAGFGLR